MRNANRLIGAAVGCLIVIGTGAASAQDWPQWRGAGREGKVTGFTPPKEWPKELKKAWSVKVGPGDATPALVGDKLYVFARDGNDEVTLCLDANEGKELWRDKNPAMAVTGAAAKAHAGPRSSPAVADGKVVTLGVGGVVSCLDADKGTLLWRKDEFPKTTPRFFASSSPLIADKTVIAQVGGEAKGGIIAFDLANGDVKWKWDAEGTAYASPVMMTVDKTQQVVALTDKSVVGITLADGKLAWKVDFVPRGMAYNAATPIVDGDMVYVTGQGRGTKALRIEKKEDGFAATEVWSNDKVATAFDTPVLKDGMLYGLSDKGNLFCLDAKTGKEVWTDTAKLDKFGEILDAGKVLMVLPASGELIVYKPGEKAYSEVAKIKVADTPTFAYPVIAKNKVFVKDQDSVTMWTFE